MLSTVDMVVQRRDVPRRLRELDDDDDDDVCRQFFTSVCDVAEPETVFNVDQYTDVTCITKPVIYISISEIVEMHKVTTSLLPVTSSSLIAA